MRRCGDCTLCCTLTRVPELNKPERVTCKHVCNGCSIYASRPASCVSYQCEWLKGNLPEEMRPDLSHVMVEEYPLMVAALIEPGYTVNDLSPESIATLDKYVENGLPVIASGKVVRLPVGMDAEEATHRLLKTMADVGVL